MEHANPAALLFIIAFVGPVLFFIRAAARGKQIFIRRIPGIDAIEEAVGRAVELGRPMSFTTGLSSLGPVVYACLGVLRHIAGKAAVYGAKLFVPSYDPEVMIMSDAVVQSAYRSARKFGRYDSSSIRFLSSEQFAYASGYMGLIHREQVASAFLFGQYAAESLILAEAGQQVGAIQVAATISNEQIPFFITACDYTLIGEELYAAGAYLSRNPVQQGSLRGQDIAKLILLALIALGVLQATWLAAVGTPLEELKVPLAEWIRASWADLFARAGS